ncbi:SPFH domain-containing protein [Streptomyces sp. NPDC047974]|uniref:SPFH domain-containing protein n=1 Tax=Streptomyces sp. NPDC047974 TaxID=3154343 RepID=UPI0033CB30A4
MTAAPPNDSGAAASRDAARTARRLTDGTLPRRPSTEAPADSAPAETEPPTAPGPTPTADPPSPPNPTPPTPAAQTVRSSTTPTPPGPAPTTPTPVASASATPAPVGSAPTTPAPAGPASVAPGAPPGNPVAAGPPPAAREAGGAVSRAAAVVPGRATPPAPEGAAGAPAGPARTETPAGPAPAQGTASPAGSPAAAPPAGSARPGGPVATAPEPAAREAGGVVSRAAAVAPGRATPPAPEDAAGAPAGPARAETPAVPRAGAAAPGLPPHAAAVPASPARPGGPVATAPESAAREAAPARTDASTGPGSAGAVPARAAAAAAAARVAEGSAGAAPAGSGSGAGGAGLPGGAGVGVFKEERELLDFGRITGMRVASVAVPVAGVGRLPRRKNLIGAETTGSIPVHLLFRDGDGAVTGAGRSGTVADDGGPDTVAMAPPTARKAKQAVIPRPATKHARPGPARPAPTADPALVERAAAVLPGWVGIAGGLLALVGCAAVVWWAGAVPAEVARMLGLPPRPYHGIHLAQWALMALGVLVLLFAVGGLGRGRVGYAWVLTLFGEYRGTVRRTGLVWASPLLLRRRVDVRLRHWRSEPLPAVDAKGTALDVTVLVVWRVRDTVRAALGVDGHEDYLREQVEAAMARVLSQLPADAFHEDAPTLRDAEAVGEALTRMLSAECAPVGLDVFSAQPTRIEYAPEVAEAMRRRRIAAIDAKHRDSVLTSVVDAVDDVVHRLTSRGLVELDDYERKALVKDLTVAFYTGRGGPGEGA